MNSSRSTVSAPISVAMAHREVAQDATVAIPMAIGVAEVVWNKTAHACPQTKVSPATGLPVLCESPDSMPIAWHNPLTNLSSLISSTDCTFPGVGPTLDAAAGPHRCGASPYVAGRNSAPWSYDNHQWLQSVRVHPNGTGFAWIHNEFHGEQPPHNRSYCSFDSKQSDGQCVLWSTDLGTTADGGATWELAAAPVLALPRPYVKDAAIAGYGALGGVVRQGGWYYAHVGRSYRNGTGAGPPGTSASGTCVFRARGDAAGAVAGAGAGAGAVG